MPSKSRYVTAAEKMRRFYEQREELKKIGRKPGNAERLKDIVEITDDDDFEFPEILDSDDKTDTRSKDLYRVEITTNKKNIMIWLISDVHAFHEDFDCKLFLTYRDWALKHGCYVITLGDLIEACIPGHMPKTMWSQQLNPSNQTKWMGSSLSGFKGRVIAMVDGNHEDRIVDATSFSPTELMCDRLNAMYMKNGGYLEILINGNVKYNLALLHGKSFSENSRLELGRGYVVYPDADLIAIGHNHKLYQEEVGSARIEGGREVFKTTMGVRTGGFLSYASYVKKKVSRPTPLGSPIVKMCATEKAISVNTSRLMD